MINWQENKKFSIDGVNFKILGWKENDIRSTIDEFLVFKPRWMLDYYASLIEDLKPKAIFELGIHRGGSCVFFHKISCADRLVAIELDTARIDAMDEYIENNGLADSLIPLYGVNQADSPRIHQIIDEQFGETGLDLVIDDASHFLDETRASFNAVFPRVRPGGMYVIEDWSWAHGAVDLPDDTVGFYPDQEPMTKLIFELVLACASTSDLIDKIEINNNSATIWRGSGEIDPETFDISRCSLARGRNLVA